MSFDVLRLGCWMFVSFSEMKDVVLKTKSFKQNRYGLAKSVVNPRAGGSKASPDAYIPEGFMIPDPKRHLEMLGGREDLLNTEPRPSNDGSWWIFQKLFFFRFWLIPKMVSVNSWFSMSWCWGTYSLVRVGKEVPWLRAVQWRGQTTSCLSCADCFFLGLRRPGPLHCDLGRSVWLPGYRRIEPLQSGADWIGSTGQGLSVCLFVKKCSWLWHEIWSKWLRSSQKRYQFFVKKYFPRSHFSAKNRFRQQVQIKIPKHLQKPDALQPEGEVRVKLEDPVKKLEWEWLRINKLTFFLYLYKMRILSWDELQTLFIFVFIIFYFFFFFSTSSIIFHGFSWSDMGVTPAGNGHAQLWHWHQSRDPYEVSFGTPRCQGQA